ncbi:MAG: hypothetical protein R3F05_15400 [Planctomycetota bacterium]
MPNAADPAASPTLVVVGTVAFDDIETPAGRRDGILGGSATYFGVAASWFTDVGIVGVIGEDFPTSTARFWRATSWTWRAWRSQRAARPSTGRAATKAP